MKIVIVGAGKVGEVLCRDLDMEGNDVILIEQDPLVFGSVMNAADINGLCGNGANYDILKEAGAGESDVFVAVTEKDEINIIASRLAKAMGAKHTIARVRNPEYSGHAGFMQRAMAIDRMINPEREAAHSMYDLVRYPMAVSLERFVRGRMSIVGVRLSKTSPYVGKCLEEVQHMSTGRVIIAMVERGSDVTVPDGSFVLEAEDIVHVTGDAKALSQFYRDCGSQTRRMRSVLIIGAGRVTHYLLRHLQNQFHVKVIERNQKVATEVAETFPQVSVICADGTDQNMLEEEGLSNFDCVIASTGIDEENLLISMYARNMGVARIITKVNRTRLLSILEPDSYGAIITPKRIIADMMVSEVRSLKNAMGSRFETLYRLAEGRVEAIQFRMHATSHLLNIPLKNLPLKKGVLLLAIIRDGKIIYPGGDDMVCTGDHIIVVADLGKISSPDDLMESW